MENKILTQAECNYLREKNINPDMPLFPLSCATAYLLKKHTDRLREIHKTARQEFVTEEYMRESRENEYKRSASTNFVGLRRFIAFMVASYVSLVLFPLMQSILHKLVDDLFVLVFMPLILLGVLFIVLWVVFSKLIKAAMRTINVNMHKKTIDAEVLALRERVKAHNLKVEKEKPEIPVLQQDISKLQDCLNKMSAYRECIPSEYWEYAYDFYEICFTRRVDTVTEAIRAFEEIQHQRRMEEQQRRQTRLMQEANETAQQAYYNSQQALEAARNADIAASAAASNAAYAASCADRNYY